MPIQLEFLAYSFDCIWQQLKWGRRSGGEKKEKETFKDYYQHQPATVKREAWNDAIILQKRERDAFGMFAIWAHSFLRSAPFFFCANVVYRKLLKRLFFLKCYSANCWTFSFKKRLC